MNRGVSQASFCEDPRRRVGSCIKTRPVIPAAARPGPDVGANLFDLQILSGFLAAIVDHLVFYLLTFAQRAQSSLLDRGNVHEYVFSTATPGRLDEAIPLRRIEPLHSACRHGTSPGYDPATVAQERGKTK